MTAAGPPKTAGLLAAPGSSAAAASENEAASVGVPQWA